MLAYKHFGLLNIFNKKYKKYSGIWPENKKGLTLGLKSFCKHLKS